MEHLSKKTEQPDWANLYDLPLFSILDKLEERMDHVRFGAVCKNWRLVAKLHHENREFKNSMLPMLTISTERKNKEKMSLYSIPHSRIYPFRPRTNNDDTRFRKRLNNTMSFICGSSHGWVATYGVRQDTITLFNPFKNNVAPIYLPPLSEKHCFSHSKVTLSADPITSGSDYVVAMFDRVYYCLSFIRAGEKCWTCLRLEDYDMSHHDFNDIAFYKGLIYVVDQKEGMVLSFDPYQVSETQMIIPIPNVVVPKGSMCYHDPENAHLVKSLEGDLLVVIKTNVVIGKRFEVYRLELGAGRGNLVKLETLGDNVLFVGRFDSFAMSASCFPNCLQKDSILYHQRRYLDSEKLEKLYFETYNIKNQSSHDHHYYDFEAYPKEAPVVFWIQPSFQWD